MTITTCCIYFLLSLLLFYTQNWIGSKTYSIGYVHFSLLDDKEEAVSINYVLKVFGPVIYLIIIAAIIQNIGHSYLLDNIIYIIYFYVGLRVFYIIAYERAAIVNWLKVIVYYFSTIIISTYIHNNFINKVDVLLPDFSEIKNEIWLLIILFIYQVGNGFDAKKSSNETYIAELPELKKRKKKYIIRNYKKLQNKYQKTINNITNSHKEDPFKLIIYAILIYENFNRPRIVRFLERIWVKLFNKEATIGIMQVKSDVTISDEESIEQGTYFLYTQYLKYTKEGKSYNNFRKTIKRHCPDTKYMRQILFISKVILDNTINSNEIFEDLSHEIVTEFGLYD